MDRASALFNAAVLVTSPDAQNMKGEKKMNIFCYPSNFRVRTKADAKKFLTISKGRFYWCDGDQDYYMEDGTVLSRPICGRGNMFFPMLVEDKPAEIIWKTRKYINAKLAAD